MNEALTVKTAIETGDAAALRRLLAENPAQANAQFGWGGANCQTNPLHYICDKRFDGTLQPEQGEALAQALIEAGADINAQNGDPLNAAASLGATEVGLALLDAGARTDFRGPLFGETSLHWAAMLGDVVLVKRLIELGAPIDDKDTEYKSAPLGWALHGWSDPPQGNKGTQRDVVVALVKAGATVETDWLATNDADVLAALRGEQ